MKKNYFINEDFLNSRLDRWFKKNICDVPQSLIEKSIRKGQIKVNKKKNKSSYKLQKEDVITVINFNYKAKIKNKEKFTYKASKKELSLSSDMFIDDNENFVVVNKPQGLAVQSGTKSKKNLIDILRNTKEFKDFSPFTVHRIDKETSGVLIVAKNRKYAQLFTSLFRIRKIHKTYLGVVVGTLPNDSGKLIDNLYHYEGEKKIISKAITRYTVLDSNNNYSLVKLNPETGRKHQLRKQLLIQGCPILGDSKYRVSDNYLSKKNALMLHAYKINFSIAGVKYNFLAEPPLSFKKIMNEKYLKSSLL